MNDIEFIEKLFSKADDNLLCNTSYPVYPNLFKKYISKKDIFGNETSLSFYIHVPFCKQLCKFCEYTRFVNGDYSHYLDLLENQIEDFVAKHTSIKYINGFDIGGGTPTVLDDYNLKRLLDIQNCLEKKYLKTENFEKSIEISLQTITDSKLKIIADAGFTRISTGIQVMSKRLLNENGRPVSEINDLILLKDKAHRLGITKFNLDLMYGMINQTDEMLNNTIQAISLIKPDHVTVYETRFNMNFQDSSSITRDKQYKQYSLLYDGLINAGYSARFGQNVFTRIGDTGVSSYLFNRMHMATPYKGFGISAQSMTLNGISYNSLKNKSALNLPNISKIDVEDNYNLPKEEILAKYICVSLYDGSINIDTCSRILESNFLDLYDTELQFLKKNKYIDIHNEYIYLTKTGFRFYGAIAALFWSKDQQKELIRR